MERAFALMGALCVGVGVWAISGIQSENQSNQKRQVRISFDYLINMAELLGHRPFVVRLANRAIIASRIERVNAMLNARGIELTSYACLACVFICASFAIILGYVMSQSLFGSLVALIALSALGITLVSRYEASYDKACAAQMPEVLRSLSSSLGAGKSMTQALDYVGRNLSDPLGSEFMRASQEVKAGNTVEEAIEGLCVRIQAPGIALLGTALSISQRTGSPLDDLFTRTSKMVSETVSLRRELEVRTSQVRLSAKVVSCIPALLAGVLTLLSPDYRDGLATSAGSACLCVAALLDISALASIRVMMGRSLA